MFFVVGWIVLCFVVAYVARQRGRSGLGLFLLSLFLSPLIGLLVAMALPVRDRTKEREAKRTALALEDLRTCPVCAEKIQRTAQKCRYCGADQAR